MGKRKGFRVELACFQPECLGNPADHFTTYTVRAQTASVAIFRAIQQWTRDTKKRIGARTTLQVNVRTESL